jgi:hypothetical protein
MISFSLPICSFAFTDDVLLASTVKSISADVKPLAKAGAGKTQR